jgi:hypothetical protein
VDRKRHIRSILFDPQSCFARHLPSGKPFMNDIYPCPTRRTPTVLTIFNHLFYDGGSDEPGISTWSGRKAHGSRIETTRR